MDGGSGPKFQAQTHPSTPILPKTPILLPYEKNPSPPSLVKRGCKIHMTPPPFSMEHKVPSSPYLPAGTAADTTLMSVLTSWTGGMGVEGEEETGVH